jgi:Ca2+-binding EF-hand superfamily protein
MQRVVGLEIRWLAIIDGIMPSSALSGPNKVDYQLFISSLTRVGLKTVSASSGGTAVSLVERLYRNRKHMEQVFKLIDRNGDGLITEAEMASFVENIKKKLGENSPHREHLEDLASVFAQLDRNHDGVIDINEFFESSRYMQY